MPKGKSDEQVALEARERAEAWGSSARQHHEAGRAFYFAKLTVLSTDAKHFGSVAESDDIDTAAILQAIKGAGWELFDAGYVFLPIEQRSGGALGTVMKAEGRIIGFFTFQRAGEAKS